MTLTKQINVLICEDETGRFYGLEREGETVAVLPFFEDTFDQVMDDAFLFAAAPDLLEALKNAAEILSDLRPKGLVLKNAIAAIAKAEGRS